VDSTQGAVLFSFPLLRSDDYRQALTADRATSEFDHAHRSLGLTRVMTWVQRDPNYAIIRWEGASVLDALAISATTTDPLMGKWRGLIRAFSGADAAGSVWDASRRQVFSWSTGEDGPETSVRLLRGTKLVTEYLETMEDFGSDPALLGVFNRIRRRQGFTRLEVWHQRLGVDDIVLWFATGSDLEAAYADIFEGKSQFDQRVGKLVAASLNVDDPPGGKPELIVDWRA
jgi:hypothetical protein